MTTIKQMVADATAVIETITVEQAKALHGSPDVTFVDLRDIRELQRGGTIEGAVHTPRGMLEFWIDPTSPYAKEVFQTGHKFVFFCAMGWRSALATKTAVDMGLTNVCHIEGGFTDWTAAGHPVVEKT